MNTKTNNVTKMTSLFSFITCAHCGNVIPVKNKSSIVLDGFLDQDTKQTVGRCCYEKHYQIKSTTKYANLYSEFPLTTLNE